MRPCILIIVVFLLIGFIGCDNNHNQRIPQSTESSKAYLERLREFRTYLIYKGPSPQDWENEPPPLNTQEVQYQSGDLTLKAWLYIPPNKQPKHPALVYFHGGFAFGLGDFMDCEPFINADFAVMFPMLRGENGNPGNFELMLGEVEDAKAAVQWLANQPFIDRNRIFAFGHSIGGGISALLSLRDDVPVQHSGSCGGLYNQDVFDDWKDSVPFDLSNSSERELRVLIGNISEMQFNHYAYLGKEDSFKEEIKSAKKEISGEKSKLYIIMINGNHFSSLKPAMQHYLSIVESE